MKGREGMPTLAADLGVTLNLRSGSENDYLQGWESFGVANNPVAAGVGNFRFATLRNPAGSGVVGVVTRWSVLDSQASTQASGEILVLIRGITADQNVLDPAQGWDLRGRPQSTLILSHNSAAFTPNGGTQVNILFAGGAANTTIDLIPPGLEIPLLPGTGLMWNSATSNTAANYAVWWRERALEDSEKF